MKSTKPKKNRKARKTKKTAKAKPVKIAKRRQRTAERIEKIKFLSFDELRRLLAAIERKRDKALFLIAYRHGLRASEVGKLRRFFETPMTGQRNGERELLMPELRN